MISKVYISHWEEDESMALELSQALWRVGLESFVAVYKLCPGISRSDLVSFGVRNSQCLVALLTKDGSLSPTVCQEIGLAKGIDLLIIPLLEKGADLPFLIDGLLPIAFTRAGYGDAIGLLIKTLRDLSRLDWLKVTCPSCGEEMTQYLTGQEEVDSALEKGSCLETLCTYCQRTINLDPRTFAPI
jgi:hypothetical protein